MRYGDDDEPPRPVIRSHCNLCSHQTKHTVISEHRQHRFEEMEIDGQVYNLEHQKTYALLECCGCEEMSLRLVYTVDHFDAEDVSYFPPRVARSRPRWIEKLAKDDRELLEEVYSALFADNRRLAIMGARAVIDRLLVRRIGDKRTFAEKLEQLVTDGILSKRDRVVLESAIDAGNAVAHRGHQPSAESLTTVMDVVEHALEAELLEAPAQELRSSTPKRQAQLPPGSAPSSSTS